MLKQLSNLFKAAPPSRHQIDNLNIKLNSPGSIFYSDFTRSTTKEIKAVFKLLDKPIYLSELKKLSNKVTLKKIQLSAHKETLKHQQSAKNKENSAITTIDREIYQATMLINIIRLAAEEYQTQLETSKIVIEITTSPDNDDRKKDQTEINTRLSVTRR